jgi:phage/plasmid-associated DNA primase
VTVCLADVKPASPESLRAHESAYRRESDPLGEFITTCCIVGDLYRVARTELFVEYQSWAKSAGESHPMDRQSLYEVVRRLAGVTEGMSRIAGKPTHVFHGVGICRVTAENGF